MKERRWSKLAIISFGLLMLFFIFFFLTSKFPSVFLIGIIFYWASFIIAIVSLFFIRKYKLRGDFLSVITIVLEIIIFLVYYLAISRMSSF